MTWPEKAMLHISRSVCLSKTNAVTVVWSPQLIPINSGCSETVDDPWWRYMTWHACCSGNCRGKKYGLHPAGGGRWDRASVFGTTYHTSYRHILLKFQTQLKQGQVTRTRQVTSPHKNLNDRQSYTDWTIVLKLSMIDTSNRVYKMYFSVFWYRWLRSILWPLHYK